MTMFHCLLPVRDEADIIGQCLDHMLKWADVIHIFDTGSVDDTWQIVQDIASRDSRVKPMRKDPVFYSENLLRGWMFEQARREMREGDWFLRVDADEFHHIPPPEFVRTRLRVHETIVWHQYYNFVLLESEVAAWEAGRETLKDRTRPIEERRTYFLTSQYSEPRLCRYRETMKWPKSVSFPYNAGFVARNRLPIRHYPHRDPVQLERRCRLRAIMMEDSQNRSHWTHPEQHHWSQSEWRKFITPDDAKGLHYWNPKMELPPAEYSNHLAAPFRRFAQRLTHGLLLPFLDSRRLGWNKADYPQRIPESLQRELETKLG